VLTSAPRAGTGHPAAAASRRLGCDRHARRSALANLATALGGAGQDDEAIAIWKQLIAIAPESERAILEQRLSEYRHRADAQQRAP